jgi:hypothetical protein
MSPATITQAVFHVGYSIFLPDFNQIWGFSTQDPNIKFPVNPSGGSRADTCGRMEGHVEANRYFSQLCERA